MATVETKYHREAKRMVTKMEREGGAAVKLTKPKAKTKKKKRLCTRAYKKLARKHPVLAPLAWLGVGLMTLLGRGTQYGGKYSGRALAWSGVRVGRVSRAASRRLAAKIIADIHKHKWVPEAELIDGKRPREFYRCDGQQFTNAQALNNYLRNLRAAGRPDRGTAPRPELQLGATAKTAGKVLVLPAERSGGRHRAGHRLPGARNAADLVNAYRENINQIGARIVALNDTTAALRRAAAQFGETPLPGPLAELRNICVGMELAMGELHDSIDKFGTLLKRPSAPGGRGGGNIAAELVNPFFGKAKEHVDAAGREFTRFIAAFEVYYATAIRLAANADETPNLDLSRTG